MKLFVRELKTDNQLVNETVRVIKTILKQKGKMNYAFTGCNIDSPLIKQVIEQLKDIFRVKFKFTLSEQRDKNDKPYIEFKTWLAY